MLPAATALVAIHPIHVLSEPIARHESHALLYLRQHVVHLVVGVHGLDDLIAALRDDCGEGEVFAVHVKPLTVAELLIAVDGVTSAWAELVLGCLLLGVAPLVARPVWMAGVITSASVVCHLLHLLVALVHVELVAATKPVEALSIAVPVMVLAFRWPWHANQVKVQVATTSGPVPLEVNVHTEGLSWKVRIIEIVCITVVSGRLVHQVESVGWRIHDFEAIVRRMRSRKVVCVVDPIFVDGQPAFSSRGFALLTEIRHAIVDERFPP